MQLELAQLDRLLLGHQRQGQPTPADHDEQAAPDDLPDVREHVLDQQPPVRTRRVTSSGQVAREQQGLRRDAQVGQGTPCEEGRRAPARHTDGDPSGGSQPGQSRNDRDRDHGVLGRHHEGEDGDGIAHGSLLLPGRPHGLRHRPLARIWTAGGPPAEVGTTRTGVSSGLGHPWFVNGNAPDG